MVTHHCRFALLLFVALQAAWFTKAAEPEPPPPGIGVLGDSYSDEYAFYPPHRGAARNWVEILSATRNLDFGPYQTEPRGTPRYAGFAYNWARSDANTEDLIAEGQHLGVAAQVAEGKVGIVCILAGGNDFLQALRDPEPQAALAKITARINSNIDQIVDPILAASPSVRILILTLPEISSLPEIDSELNSGRLSRESLKLACRGVHAMNTHIRALPKKDSRILVADLATAVRLALLGSSLPIATPAMSVNWQSVGNDPGSAFLEDLRHPGTLLQGYLAQFILTNLKTRMGVDVHSLSSSEVIDFAARTGHEHGLASVRPPAP